MKTSPIPNLLRLAALGLLGALAVQPSLAQRPLGIDVSDIQGSGINWTSVHNAGYSFAWAKATEGTGYVASSFVPNMNHAKAAGVFIGGYDFARPDLVGPTSEAAFFWSHAGGYMKNDGLSFQPMLDMETFQGLVGASSYASWANQWCNAIVSDGAGAGVVIKPFIYTTTCESCNMDGSIGQWLEDMANPSGENAQTGSPWDFTSCGGCNWWGPWNVWQYDWNGVVSGVPGIVDRDVYGGDSHGLIWTDVIDGSSEINVFYCGTNNIVWNEWWNGTWGNSDLPGTPMTPGATPCATSKQGSTILNVYYRGTDGHLYSEFWFNNTWNGPQSLGGSMALGSSPVALVPPNGDTSVFYRGNDSQLYIIQWNGSAWGAPTALGGSIATNTSPSCIAHASGILNIFYHGTDGQLYNIFWYNGWGSQALGGTLAANSSPSAVMDDTAGTTDVFIRGTDNQLYATAYFSGSWHSPQALGGTGNSAMTSNPTATRNPNGNLNCFYRGADGQLYSKFWAGSSWGGPQALGGAVDPNYSLASEVMSGGNVNCYYRGTNGSLWTEFWNVPTSSWMLSNLGGTVAGSPCAIAH